MFVASSEVSETPEETVSGERTSVVVTPHHFIFKIYFPSETSSIQETEDLLDVSRVCVCVCLSVCQVLLEECIWYFIVLCPWIPLSV